MDVQRTHPPAKGFLAAPATPMFNDGCLGPAVSGAGRTSP
jgi:hypothetical protein